LQFDKYTIETKGIRTVCKSPSAWGCKKGTNGYRPLVYFLKPKWMADSDFKEIIACMRIDFPKDKIFTEVEK